MKRVLLSFFFQAEDGIRDYKVTGVQTCALPIWSRRRRRCGHRFRCRARRVGRRLGLLRRESSGGDRKSGGRERVEISVVAGSLKKKKTRSLCLQSARYALTNIASESLFPDRKHI